METVVSCCGVVCSECPYYPADCAGCPAIGGKVFWLQYTSGDVCDIFRCCAERGHAHCGRCEELPCHRYFDHPDPTKSAEENEADFQKQMEHLRAWSIGT